MTETTITEALAQLKVLDKRIAKKREFIQGNALRPEFAKDPHAKAGGSAELITQEMQAIRDMQEQKVSIRRAIKAANGQTEVTIGKQTRTIADWLVWRRDVAPMDRDFLRGLSSGIEQERRKLQKGAQVVPAGSEAKPSDLVVNIPEFRLSQEIEDLEAALETLDGQLSLKNATVLVSY